MNGLSFIFALSLGLILCFWLGRATARSNFGSKKKEEAATQSDTDRDSETTPSDNSTPRFDSNAEAGNHGESLVRQELKRLIGSHVIGYITSKNVYFDRRNFEIDFLILVPGVGLIIAEVKYYAGDVYCTDAPIWKQSRSGSESERKNASLQVLRTRDILQKLLRVSELGHWPLIPVVIFVHPSARIFRAKSERAPQTDVIKLDMLKSWLVSFVPSNQVTFSRTNFESIRAAIKTFEQEYQTN